ncbi:hypothetical protein [Robbsia sp. KACC 23696]|uniref:hypothetical protein n=1 Tax=Robbsia sp. KACC 23696 TaxID=3149231 RepID=UPI00325A8561
MKPSIADTVRAYLLPAVATVCSAQVAMLFAMLLLDTPESVFQGPLFRCGIGLAIMVAIVSVRRRAGRAFHAATRNGTVRMRHARASSGRSADAIAVRPSTLVAGAVPSIADTHPVSKTTASDAYVSVLASCPERALVVLYLQFRRLPFAIESGERSYTAPSVRHA